jgi:hypothetical protein
MKMNCWGIKKCGRHPNGDKVAELGICPASEDSTYHGKNNGTKAGRYCWRVAGTMCGGQVQGTWAMKIQNCAACDFFKLVEQEEGESFDC